MTGQSYCWGRTRGLLLGVFATLLVGSLLPVVRSDEGKENAITVLGLGKMGESVVRCLATSSSVHVWNRGVDKRQNVADVATKIHETAQEAVSASSTTVILIDDWDGTAELLTKELEFTSDQTIAVFSTYTPMDIQNLLQQDDAKFSSSPSSSLPTLVGGAIVGVPETICSENALILLSGDGDLPQLKGIGRTVSFPGSNVGLASLANLALILVITFGVAGQELALLMIRQALATSDEDDASAAGANFFLETFNALATEIGPTYTKILLPLVFQSMTKRDYQQFSYVPVSVFRNLLRRLVTYLQELQISDKTFLTAYVEHLEQVPNEKEGPAAWTELATTDGKTKDEL